MAKPVLYAEKRNRSIIERYHNIQKEFYESNPELKGYIYPEFFYVKTSNEVNLSPKYIRKLARKYLKNSNKAIGPHDYGRNYI